MLFLNQILLAKLKGAVEHDTQECCGFVFGYEAGLHRTITDIMRVDNTSFGDKRRSFAISSKAYRDAENFAECNNLQLLGIYHSHPNCPAIPSEYDRMAALPYFSYLILSIMNNKFHAIRSWNLNSNFQFEEESLAITHINTQLHGYRNYPNTAA
jgi:proteasome lid subunit RPN8/RPN11